MIDPSQQSIFYTCRRSGGNHEKFPSPHRISQRPRFPPWGCLTLKNSTTGDQHHTGTAHRLEHRTGPPVVALLVLLLAGLVLLVIGLEHPQLSSLPVVAALLVLLVDRASPFGSELVPSEPRRFGLSCLDHNVA